MFDRIAQELESLTGAPKSDKKLYITQEEFDNFCKNFLFEEIKGNDKLGEAFCEKYNEPNYVLSILLDNRTAKEHIRKFYVK